MNDPGAASTAPGPANTDGTVLTMVKPKPCWFCGLPFVGKTQQQRMCSQRCRSYAAQSSSGRSLACPIYVRGCELCDSLFVARDSKGRFCSVGCRTARTSARIYHFDCQQCGKAFVARRNVARDCAGCRQWRSRVSKKDRGLVYGAARRRILERDGWRCHLCGSPILTRAFRNRPGDPTVDHLIPRSAGGTNDPSNLAAAHHGCNRKRGVKPIAA